MVVRNPGLRIIRCHGLLQIQEKRVAGSGRQARPPPTGCGLSTFPEYATLRELHLVANAVRHGPGRSLTELWEAHPELWAPDSEIIRLRPWYMPAKEPLSQFIVSEADMNRYNDAVCTFWNRVAEAALTEGEGSD